jgi:hypothetical protein
MHVGNLLSPTIAVKGTIVGTWTRTLSADKVTVHPRFFAPRADGDMAAVRSAARRYGEFLGAPAVIA